ncbi:MAG: S-methyl-5-thioribose-1-phosphate isomerase, partial [Anaerolineae bacterium CG03_land_8_20_14_0_80_58_20]
MRTIFWEDNQVKMIDQRRLPNALEILACQTHAEVAQAIKDMAIRGAPAIGAAAAFGLALAAQSSPARTPADLLADLHVAAALLRSARPTAVNLAWALERVLRSAYSVKDSLSVDDLRRHILSEAQKIADEDVEINRRMARHGADLIADGDTI